MIPLDCLNKGFSAGDSSCRRHFEDIRIAVPEFVLDGFFCISFEWLRPFGSDKAG
jgi:hypothetical protein